MKTLNEYITEKFKLNSKNIKKQYNYHPKDKEELLNLVEKLLLKHGANVDLNDIDTSKIDDMSFLFSFNRQAFNGDISEWDVSNVTDMTWMFADCQFNGDISQWNVSNVIKMNNMFVDSKFSGDISQWDVSKVNDMVNMFDGCPLQKNPPKWYHE